MLWSSLSQRIVHKSAAGRFAWGPQVMQWLGQASWQPQGPIFPDLHQQVPNYKGHGQILPEGTR